MDSKNIIISGESPFSPDAVSLMDELSECLKIITGDSGKSSFEANDVCNSRAAFVIARDQSGKAIGCGALRPINEKTAELKRMYAQNKGMGVDNQILSYLERWAYEIGYQTICLETRTVNAKAISFYKKNGYRRIPNYGKYIGRTNSVCFEKYLSF